MPASRLSTGTLIAIVTGSVLFAAFLVWAGAVFFLKPSVSVMPTQTVVTPEPAVPTVPFDPSTAHAAWKQEVASKVPLLTQDSTPAQITAVEQDLLGLRVLADDRAAHMQLIIALDAFAKGDADGYAQLQTAFAATQK